VKITNLWSYERLFFNFKPNALQKQNSLKASIINNIGNYSKASLTSTCNRCALLLRILKSIAIPELLFDAAS